MNKIFEALTLRFSLFGALIVAYFVIAFYWGCWVLYFAGVQTDLVIYSMVVLPPLVFFSAGVAEKVWPIPITAIVFLVFHLLVALENF